MSLLETILLMLMVALTEEVRTGDRRREKWVRVVRAKEKGRRRRDNGANGLEFSDGGVGGDR